MVAVAALLCVSTARSNPGASYAEGWNVSGDPAGWEANTTKTSVAVVDTGGNPGGYLQSTSTGAFASDAYAGANTRQAALTGNYTGASTWESRVDIRFESGTFTEAWLRFRYQDGTYNGWHYPLTSSLPMGTWQSFAVVFDTTWTDAEATAAGWVRESSSVDWQVLWTDVYTTEVRIFTTVGSVFGIDNYQLTANPSADSPPFFDQPTAPACNTTFDWLALKELRFPVAASDPDLAGPVTLTAISIPAGATYAPDPSDASMGTFTWTPALADDDGAARTIHLRATDFDGDFTDCTMTVYVKGDSDGDGLPDAWETDGYTYNGETVRLDLMGANPNAKDVFVEIDYMDDPTGDSHMPDMTALGWIQAAFAAQGITLHVNVDQALPHQTVLGTGSSAGTYDWSAVDAIKTQIGTGGVEHFSEAKSLAIRYCIFAHEISTGDSGVARAGGSDFIVSLGAFTGEISDQYDQAGTFMHELGHVLGLLHGGADDLNNKPNYLSVMNYLFQTTGLRKSSTWGHFDYSGGAFPQLVETNLDEGVGLNAGAAWNAYGTRWISPATGAKETTDAANGPINWNGSGSDTQTGVSADINGDGITFLPLDGHNDWANLVYDGGTIGAGTPIPAPVITPAEELDQPAIDETTPDAVDKAKGHVSKKKLHLTWKPAKGVDIVYHVYRAVDGGDYEPVGETTVSNFHDRDVAPGKTYSYYVTWVQNGIESQPTDEITLELK
jgi:hypothetical protein